MATEWGNYTGKPLPLSSHSPSDSAPLTPFTDYTGPSKAPGTAIHVTDPRLNLLAALSPALFNGKTCLDIGCNAGSVSCQLG